MVPTAHATGSHLHSFFINIILNNFPFLQTSISLKQELEPEISELEA